MTSSRSNCSQGSYNENVLNHEIKSLWAKILVSSCFFVKDFQKFFSIFIKLILFINERLPFRLSLKLGEYLQGIAQVFFAVLSYQMKAILLRIKWLSGLSQYYMWGKNILRRLLNLESSRCMNWLMLHYSIYINNS